MEYKCFAVPKTTVKRCRNYSTDGTNFCLVHGKIKGKQNVIQLYNGSIYTFGRDLKDIKNFTPQIFMWKELNRAIYNAKKKSVQKRLEKQAKLVRCGSATKLANEFEKLQVFQSKEEMTNFFKGKQKAKKKKKTLDDMRHFLGVIYYFNRHIDVLKKIQIQVHIRHTYGDNIESVLKIQKWFRHRMWLKKLPVKPTIVIKHYLPNINKIITTQRQVKKFISIKIKHSHNCPYSLERYTDIPVKYRAVYEYTEGKSKHWRYYNIKWLDADWKSQTEEKRYVTEPTIKREFPEEFVEKIARQIWYLSRKENDFGLEEDESTVDYAIENDWHDRFSRRSLYRFSLMMLDLCDILDVKVNNIRSWRAPDFKLKYQVFYLRVMPALKNIASNTHLHSLEENMYYITRDMFRNEFIFPDTDISDLLSGDAIYGIIRMLLLSKRQNIEVHDIIKDIIKENFQVLLMA